MGLTTDLGPIVAWPEIAVRAQESRIVLKWPDGHVSAYGWLWLRDCCGCDDCRGDGSRQRLNDLASSSPTPRPTATACGGGSLLVSWEPGGHESRHQLSWLRQNCGCGEHEYLTTPPPERWEAGSDDLPFRRSLDQVRADDGALEAWLRAVSATGIAVLCGASTDPGTVACVVDLFGHVRETNYGRIFDVVTTVDPSNLAFTSLPLGPHTDNPYREPAPTLQLLHCLVSSTTGGDSIFVDGLEATAVLSREDPEAHELLAKVPVSWRYADDSTELACQAPVLGLDAAGNLRAIRFNERARVPGRLPAEVAEAHLEALRTFALILERPDLQLRIRLEPGEVVCFDNLRVLHGRTGFDSAGERHLQGCYADRDGLESRLAVLRRTVPAAGRRHATGLLGQ